MKTINTEKLRTMGLAKAQAACLIHAEKALTYQAEGNDHLFERHCDLLDQCAAIGRSLKYGKPTEAKRSARAAVLAV